MRYVAWTLLILVLLPVLPGAAQEPSFPVKIAPDIQPRMRPEEVAQRVISIYSQREISGIETDESGQVVAKPTPAQVLNVYCIHGRDFSLLVPYSAVEDIGFDPVWVVRLQALMTKRTPGGDTLRSDTGWYAVDDATGNIVGSGSPWPDNPPPLRKKPEFVKPGEPSEIPAFQLPERSDEAVSD